MHAFSTLASRFLALLLASCVYASVYVTKPNVGTVCTGGRSCEVTWEENGESPLLGDIGECQVGLYTGNFNLAQSLPSVDVATTTSFSFTPDPAGGPDGLYYLVFTAEGINYQGFSSNFTLDGMNKPVQPGGYGRRGR